MWIKKVFVKSIEALRQDFSLPDLWKCAENGTLAAFERGLAPDSEGIRDEIIALLEGDTDGGFLTADGRFQPERLEAAIRKFGDQTVGYDCIQQQGFLDRNRDELRRLTYPLTSRCSVRQADELYLFVLLHLQIVPKETLRPENCEFLKKQLAGAVDELPEPASRLCLYGREILMLENGAIKRRSPFGQWEPFFQAETEITSFTCNRQLGLIAIDRSGQLCSKPHPAVRRAAAGQELCTVAAYGERFALLTREGALLGNLPGLTDWKAVHRLHMGLNSLTGICGRQNRVAQLGSEPLLQSFTGVHFADTRTEETRKRFILLRRDGTVYIDHSEKAESIGSGSPEKIYAVCLHRGGWLAASQTDIFYRRFDEAEWHPLAPLHSLLPTELHAGEGHAVCGGMRDGKFEVLVFDLPAAK